ncbi:hypothetical protein PG994_004495 [Apiospora phragmitis]|uniref:Heterokaryon incompatibility domain-containing protein n=1 Tax=Apiospora phragmitis TaxID=2905665 RepID=A0ABR1VTE9_9PEZI
MQDFPKPYYLAYDQLYTNRHCLICMHVLPAVNTRIPDSVLQSIPHSRLGVDILGPIDINGVDSNILASGWEQIREKRIAQNLPLGIWISLNVSIEPEPDDPTQAGPGLHSLLHMRRHIVRGGKWGRTPFRYIYSEKAGFDSAKKATGLNAWAEPRWRPRFNGVENMLPGFRLIDTHSCSIVQPDTPVPFVALSYMWSSGGAGSCDIKLEKAKISLLENPGSLTESRLPKLILHAMSLCRELGEEFLWVDRLCIVQDDQDLKSAQIEAMGSIYRSASFTIFAALNSRTPGMGLPGHAGQARRPWSSAFRPPLEYYDKLKVVIPNGLRVIVDPLMWNRRGWTFQERLLSKRLLFITEYQAIFQCSSGVAEEELTWDWNYSRIQSTQETEYGRRTSTRWNDDSTTPRFPAEPGLLLMPGQVEDQWDNNQFPPDVPTFASYKRSVKDYSSRQLSLETDILNAFSGVANVMATGFGSRMLFGLPERFLPQCLLWTCDGPSVGRGDRITIPSWSWASCAKPIDYGWNSSDFGFGEDANMCSIVQYYYQDPDEGLRELATEQRWDAPRNDNRLAAAFPGALVFNTTVASLKIGNLNGEGDAAEETPENADICNAARERVGRLARMGRDWIRARQSSDENEKMFDFIILCGSLAPYGHRQWLVRGGQSKSIWQLQGMLVERLPYKPFIARRVDIGMVSYGNEMAK